MPSNTERTYFVFCQDNCKFEGMTKEQILNAIAEATGVVPESIDVDAAFITKIKEMNADNNLKFWVGTKAQYNAIEEKARNVLYIITDDDYDDPITELNAAIQDLTTAIENIISGETTVSHTAAVNNIAQARNENGVLVIGDFIIPQKKLLWSGLEQGTRSSVKTITLSEPLKDGDVIEVWWTESITGKELYKTKCDCQVNASNVLTVASGVQNNGSVYAKLYFPCFENSTGTSEGVLNLKFSGGFQLNIMSVSGDDHEKKISEYDISAYIKAVYKIVE